MDIKIVAAHFIFAAFDIIVHSFLKEAKNVKISSYQKQEMIRANQNYLCLRLYRMNVNLYNACSIYTVILNGYNVSNKKGTKEVTDDLFSSFSHTTTFYLLPFAVSSIRCASCRRHFVRYSQSIRNCNIVQRATVYTFCRLHCLHKN